MKNSLANLSNQFRDWFFKQIESGKSNGRQQNLKEEAEINSQEETEISRLKTLYTAQIFHYVDKLKETLQDFFDEIELTLYIS